MRPLQQEQPQEAYVHPLQHLRLAHQLLLQARTKIKIRIRINLQLRARMLQAKTKPDLQLNRPQLVHHKIATLMQLPLLPTQTPRLVYKTDLSI